MRASRPAILLAFAIGLIGCSSKSGEPGSPGTGGTGGGAGGTTGGSAGGTTGGATGGTAGFSGPRPAEGQLASPAVSDPAAPPPISGGTLLVLADGKTAFAAERTR
jgi:hypothetical protein